MTTPNKKVPLTPSSTYTSDPFAQSLRTALVANSSIPTIQSTLSNELQRTGWTANLRTYVTALMRSGECVNYEELMEKVLAEALGGTGGGKGEGGEEGLRIPESVKEKGVKVVRDEISKVVDFEGEEGDS